MSAITSKCMPMLAVGLAILLSMAPGCARKVSTAVEDQSLVTASTPSEAPPPAAAPEPEAPPPAPEEPATPAPPAPPEQQAAAPVEPPPMPAEPPAETPPAVETPPAPAAPPAMEETRVAESPLTPSEEPPPPPAPAPEPSPAPAPAAPPEVEISDVYFDFDEFGLRSDAKTVLEANVRAMKADGSTKWLIEGHCDERGSLAYNLVLGERRAESVKRYLEDLGIAPAQLQIVTYGKERPFCKDHSEACWQSNRRAHFVRR